VVRQIDDRAERLRDLGAEVVVADLTKTEEVFPILQGCSRVFFSLSVSAQYLEATVVMAAAAKACPEIELVVNMSQMTVSEIDLVHVSESPQHRQQWLGEQALNWSGVPVTHLRPTAFQQNPLFWNFAAQSIEGSGSISPPLGSHRTSPIAANDVAEVAAKILLDPTKYKSQVIELTGPTPLDIQGLAKEYSLALGRPVSSSQLPLETWTDQVLSKVRLPEHVFGHVYTMAKLHSEGRYDRYTNSVEEILGRPAASISATIQSNRDAFPVRRNGISS
jgi:uncharacterized protein YbjT (DUF2867 family)